MEARAPIRSAFDLFMATQAFVIGNLIAQHVTFCAVEHPFQIRMRLRQVAWRQLRFHLQDKAGEEKDNM